MNDESRLRDLLAGSVPQPPVVPERAERARAQALTRRRRRAAAVAAGSVVVVAVVAVPMLGSTTDRSPAPDPTPTPETTTSAPEVVAGDFDCPSPWMVEGVPPNPAEDGPTTLRSGAVAVRLCSGNGEEFGPEAPLDALVTDVGELVSLINEMPLSGPPKACPMNLGPTLGLAFQYADGSVQVVQAQAHGCGGVLVGGRLRGDASTAWRPIDRFTALLVAQRSEHDPPNLTVPLGCDGPISAVTTSTPPVSLTRAVLCWQYVTETALPPSSAEIPADDLATLLDDLNANVTRQAISEDECVSQDVTLRIMGQNAWGDHVLLHGDCGAFDLGQQNRAIWRPDARSQAILDQLVASQPLTLPEPTARTTPDEVVTLWADLVNNGESERADELWVGDPPVLSGTVDLKTAHVRDRETRAEVSSLYRVVPADGSFVDYHEVVFTLTRPSLDSPWRIASMDDKGMVPTGR